MGYHDYINVPDCIDKPKQHTDENEEEDDGGIPPVPPPKDYLPEPPVRRSGATTPPPPPLRKESDVNNNKKGKMAQRAQSRENVNELKGRNEKVDALPRATGINGFHTPEPNKNKGKMPKKTKSHEALDKECREQDRKAAMLKANSNEKLGKHKFHINNRSKSNEQLDAINAELSKVIFQARSENNLGPPKPERQGLDIHNEKRFKPVIAIKPQAGASPKPSPKPKPRFASKLAMFEASANG